MNRALKSISSTICTITFDVHLVSDIQALFKMLVGATSSRDTFLGFQRFLCPEFVAPP